MKKFGAKQITALTAALAIATVGGVYATWSFTSTSGYPSNNDTFNFILEEAVNGDKSGSYTFAKSGTIYHIDQYSVAKDSTTYNGNIKVGDPGAGGTVASHAAALCVADDAYVTITFQATGSADDDVYDYGLNSTITLTLSCSSYYSYSQGSSPEYTFSTSSGTALYTQTSVTSIQILPTNVNVTNTSNQLQWTSEGSGKFTCTIGSAMLLSLIDIAYVVVEDYTTSYLSFSGVAANSSITAVIAQTT